MKNYREYFAECFEAEKPKFLRVLRAIPEGQAAYKPHPRSTSTGDLVWLLASELQDACELIDHGEVNFVLRPAPALSESISTYERNAADLQKRLAAVDDGAWDRNVRFLVNGAAVWETTLGDMLFGFLFDAIQCRQFTDRQATIRAAHRSVKGGDCQVKMRARGASQ
jgi:hypothetical protein